MKLFSGGGQWYAGYGYLAFRAVALGSLLFDLLASCDAVDFNSREHFK
jgi:hypothetical protein